MSNGDLYKEILLYVVTSTSTHKIYVPIHVWTYICSCMNCKYSSVPGPSGAIAYLCCTLLMEANQSEKAVKDCTSSSMIDNLHVRDMCM